MVELGRRRWAVVTACAAGLAAGSCGPGIGVATDTVDAYLEAVQLEDVGSLFCLSSGAAGSESLGEDREERLTRFEAWARAEYDLYLEGRDEGRVDLSSSGIVLAKAFTLGRGTFYTLRSARSVGDGILEADMVIRFAYADIDISRLPVGTRFYVCGAPPGIIHDVEIQRGPAEERREVLESIVVRWTLVREPAADGCDVRWTVHAAEPVAASETMQSVVWTF